MIAPTPYRVSRIRRHRPSHAFCIRFSVYLHAFCVSVWKKYTARTGKEDNTTRRYTYPNGHDKAIHVHKSCTTTYSAIIFTIWLYSMGNIWIVPLCLAQNANTYGERETMRQRGRALYSVVCVGTLPHIVACERSRSYGYIETLLCWA